MSGWSQHIESFFKFNTVEKTSALYKVRHAKSLTFKGYDWSSCSRENKMDTAGASLWSGE